MTRAPALTHPTRRAALITLLHRLVTRARRAQAQRDRTQAERYSQRARHVRGLLTALGREE